MTQVPDLALLASRFEVLTAQQRAADAVELLEGQAAHHGDEPLFWVLLGRAFAMDRRFVDAEAAGRRAVELEPDAVATQVTLLLAFIGRRRADEAVDLARSIVERHAEDPDAHHWLSQALLARRRDHQDLVVAHQAARHALSLKADAGAFLQAAQTASLLDDDREARALLADGLAQFPQDRDLLLLSGRIKGGETVVGPREELVGGILRSSPLDAPAEADLAGSPLRWLRGRLFLLWYHVLAFALLAVLPLPVPVLLAVTLLGAAVHAALVLRSYRRLEAVLPPDYLREQLTDPARGRTGATASAAAAVLVLAGTVLAALHPVPGPGIGDVLLVPAAVVLAGGLLSVDRSLARLSVAGHAEDRRRQGYHLVRFGDNASSYRRYWLAALAGIVLVTVTASTGGDATAGAGMLSVGILWTVKTLDLVAHSRAVDGGENPWVTGAALSRPGRGRQPVRARLMGARFLLVLLLVCCFTSLLGFGILIGGFVEGS